MLSQSDNTIQSKDYFAKANSAFVDDDFTEALNLYNEAIKTADSESVEPPADYFAKRSIVQEKLGSLDQALADARRGVELAEKQQLGNKEKARVLLRLGQALCAQKQSEEAKVILQNALDLCPEDKQISKWIENASKMEPLPAAPSATTVKLESQKPEVLQAQPVPTPSTTSKIRHEWYQDDKFVTIQIFAKNLVKDDVSVNFSSKSVSVTVALKNGNDYSLELDLSHEIDPKESYFRILSTKVEIKVKKESLGLKWGTLEGEDTLLQSSVPAATAVNAVPSYPSSAKNRKNWDLVEKDVKEMEKNEKPEGEQALNALFQQIYSNADEDTRRAMNKSFMESNGTALSTNWKEVGKGKVDCKPPDGMIAKPYEK